MKERLISFYETFWICKRFIEYTQKKEMENMSEQKKIQELERRIATLENQGGHPPGNDPGKILRRVIWGILIVFFLLTAIGVMQFVSAG
ncbi:hypothetical protein H70357_26320 [Paenibacillus sp. FSL H7-0357]|nr:hypothetical protein H70357_26320 [Paenibacillus sp. FSL H7-0357]